MDTILNKGEEKKGINKGLIIGVIVGIVAIGGVLLYLSTKPSEQEQIDQILKGSYHEGSPEFAELTKDIIISTDLDKTVESPTGLGTISMWIGGKIHNKGDKVINGLEVSVWVVTQFKEKLKEKSVLVIPRQQPVLNPGETIPITLTLDGFDKNDDRADIRWKVTAIRVQP
ncbi:MAG TPA: hypothetical protein VL325_02120 [Pyrinomonadaceae bacterium]|nr:hypothetical protein [Pyrinomonadaceae bacterium]